MLLHRQQQRRWAARMLWLWGFALLASVANACLGPNPGPEALDRAGIRIAATISGHDAAPHAHAGDGTGVLPVLPVHDSPAAAPSQAPANAPCQDFCEQDSVPVPALKTLPGGAVDAGLLSALGPTLPPQPATAPSAPWVPREASLRPPPIPIVFLRLAR